MENRFYQMPQFIIEEKKYNEIRNNSKIAYMLLYNRHRLSEMRDRYQDKNGVFVYYTREEMQKDLNIGKNTSIKVFKELKKANLIIEKKEGKHYKIYLIRV